MYKQAYGVLVMLVIGAGIAVGQETPEPVKATPVTAQEEAGSNNGQLHRLSKPDFISIRLVPGADDTDGGAGGSLKSFNVGDRMVFRLLLTNNSVEPLEFMFIGTYSHHRPRLLKDGEVIPYREEIMERLRRTNRYGILSAISVTMEPNLVKTEWFELNAFYDPLPPGRYQLVVGRRFIEGGDWIESEPTFFEVILK